MSKSWKECWFISAVCLVTDILMLIYGDVKDAIDAGILIGFAFVTPCIKAYFD